MRCNIWLVVLLAIMPLFILVVGLAAAADGFHSPAVWALLVMTTVAGAAAARMAIRTARRA